MRGRNSSLVGGLQAWLPIQRWHRGVRRSVVVIDVVTRVVPVPVMAMLLLFVASPFGDFPELLFTRTPLMRLLPFARH